MSSIEQHCLPIIIGLLLIILLLSTFIVLLKLRREKSHSNDGVNTPSDSVPLEKHKEILRKWEELRDKNKNIESGSSDVSDYLSLQEEYKKACLKIEELKRSNYELNEIINKYKKRVEKISSQEKQERYGTPSKNGSQVILYASFPRSAGSNSYFSDLTDNLSADSYFELKVSDGTGKAVFKPLDFMKIRNYDAAMAAIVTEGVKPNVALSVVGIEPGIAHLEEKVWIIV